jgi:hypothetical protein
MLLLSSLTVQVSLTSVLNSDTGRQHAAGVVDTGGAP